MRRRFLLAVGALVVVLVVGAAGAWLVLEPSEPSGSIDTDLEGVTTLVPKKPPKKPRKPRRPVVTNEEPCWEEFGGDPQRSLSRVRIQLGKPTRAIWARAMGSYMEYPPSYCDGTLYVNTFRGRTAAFDARTGRLLWSRKHRGAKHSTPAIAGQRLIVSSKSGSVRALDRETGALLWQLRTSAKIESSPVAIGNTVYFGATDGRLYAVNVATGAVRWAYDTGGRINASPSIWGDRICISTYAGSLFCLDRRDGSKAMEPVLQPRLFPQRELLCQPVN